MAQDILIYQMIGQDQVNVIKCLHITLLLFCYILILYLIKTLAFNFVNFY